MPDRATQKANEIDPKLLKTRSQELDKLSSILTSGDHIENIVSCNLEVELGGGQEVGYMDLSGILVHLSEKADRFHFFTTDSHFPVYCNELSAVGFKKAVIGDFLLVKIKDKSVKSFVNRLSGFPQFNKLPDFGKPKSATLIYHSQSDLNPYLKTLLKYEVKQYAAGLIFHTQALIFGLGTLLLGAVLAASVLYNVSMAQNLLIAVMVGVMAFSAFRKLLLPIALLGVVVGWVTSFVNTAVFLVALAVVLGVWLGLGSLTVYWKNKLPKNS